MKSFLAAILAYFGPTVGAIKGFLTPAELQRAFATASGASTVAGFVVAFLTVLGTDAAANPKAGFSAATVTFVITFLSDLFRRLSQGADPIPTPVSPTSGSTSKPTLSHIPTSKKDVLEYYQDGILSLNEARKLLGVDTLDLPA